MITRMVEEVNTEKLESIINRFYAVMDKINEKFINISNTLKGIHRENSLFFDGVFRKEKLYGFYRRDIKSYRET